MTTPRLTLHSLQLRVVSVPLRRPIVSNPIVGRFTEWPFILVDLRTHEGVVGRAYLEPYVLGSARYIVPAIEAAAERLGNSPLAPIDAYRGSVQALNLHGREGVSIIAAAALDMAIWDAIARAANQPLAVALGGSVGPVRAYNTNGLWLLPPDELAEQAHSLVEEGGFGAIKMRFGRPTLAADLEAVRIVREAIGPGVRLMSDFNQGLDRAEALWRLHALDDEGLQWFEEPLQFDDLEGSAQLARELKTPIQIGENIYGPRGFWRAVQTQAADLYMPDLMRIGGVTGWMRCAAIAGAAGLPLSSHLYPEVSAHLLRVSETADWLEWRDWAHPLLAAPFEVKDGMVIVPDRPGSGIEWDEAAVMRLQR